MNSQTQSHGRRRGLALLAAAVFTATVGVLSLEPTDATTARVRVTGRPTGEIGPDGPVYRLPAVRVVTERRTELARIEREEQLGRAREARAKSARKPNV